MERVLEAISSQLRGGQHSASAGLEGLLVPMVPTAKGIWAPPDGAAHLWRSLMVETGSKKRFLWCDG